MATLYDIINMINNYVTKQKGEKMNYNQRNNNYNNRYNDANYHSGGNASQDKTPRNMVSNFVLKCFNGHRIRNGKFYYSCAFTGTKNENGTYGKSLTINVITNEECLIERGFNFEDYCGDIFAVEGRFTTRDYMTRNGIVLPAITIFADRITRIYEGQEADSKGQYANRRNNNGRSNNNYYENGNYRGNGNYKRGGNGFNNR